MRHASALCLCLFTICLSCGAKAADLDCKDIAWKARLIMTARQMNGDIVKLTADTEREGWPFAREMILEAYALPLETKAEKQRPTGAMEAFGNEWGRRCLAGELD
ncbi:hypothetical protein [Paragemmobacter straminiformis]|uniref:HdeA/HdeB family protein n=1 Tax=Paragemmobacter straminiformis TaxID=2045119 RepID=A0A842I593_9RHOB|nr:hypothetical protein [Gemmobacter straminiformis]MBC2834695.1 hypothetical protein [Gemmobacter straminiformis]